MKKFFIYLGLLILALVLFVLIAGLFISKDYHFEKSVVINKSPNTVWPFVSSLAAQDKWSPWSEYDPNIQSTFEGTDGTVGSVHHWKGNKEVGSGSQTITAVDAPNKINVALKFLEPYESEAQGFITLQETAPGATTLTWGFDSHMPYPFNVMSLCMNMDKMMDKDFSNGLGKLKAMAEAVIEPTNTIVPVVFEKGQKSITLTGSLSGLYDSKTYLITAVKGQKFTAELNPETTPANVRIKQLDAPSGTTNGPFDLKMNYTLNEAGIWKLTVDESNMVGEAYTGNYTLVITLK